ncbi:hypothetical protein EXN66_Car009336 [Channa argus]|uniref:Uncharacterized protein n=1 Tax=Channa argus TaxID=215402 RepID=A0A6G1PTM9_CHAAH|nr:hypothetical protein EXN66_Car009336 [Channa argus]
MEEEALRNYCRVMIGRVRNNLLQKGSSEMGTRRHKHKKGRGREGTKPERQVVPGDEFRGQTKCILPLRDRNKWGRGETSLGVTCQGLEVQHVPVQLLSMVTLKMFKEDMKRVWQQSKHVLLCTVKIFYICTSCVLYIWWQAAEVKLHDPSACVVCQEENASLALKTFIWRKKTQLQFQTLKAGLNTHVIYGVTLSDFKDRADLSK